MSKDAGSAVADDAVTEMVQNICSHADSLFLYFEANILNVADRHFQYALGAEVFQNMATNNIAEGQNSRFDEFVEGSTNVGSMAELVDKAISYIASASSTYIVAKGSTILAPGASDELKARSPSSESSVSLGPWKLGQTLVGERKNKEKTAVAPWKSSSDL